MNHRKQILANNSKGIEMGITNWYPRVLDPLLLLIEYF